MLKLRLFLIIFGLLIFLAACQSQPVSEANETSFIAQDIIDLPAGANSQLFADGAESFYISSVDGLGFNNAFINYQNKSTIITNLAESEGLILLVLDPTFPVPPSVNPSCSFIIGNINNLTNRTGDSNLDIEADNPNYIPGSVFKELSSEQFADKWLPEFNDLALATYAHVEANCELAENNEPCEDCSGCPDILGGPKCTISESQE